MSETISIYHLDNKDKSHPMDRKLFYDSQIKVITETGEPTMAAGVVNLFLFNTEGEIILQKRSNTKRHNARLIDKSIGGHVTWGDKPSYSMMVETVQELRVPSIVLRSEDDFRKTYKTLRSYLDNIAIIQELDRGIFKRDIVIDGNNYNFAHMVSLYLGVYTGSTKPVDGEASGVLYYNLETLEDEMNDQPQLFTQDLHLYLKKYKKEIKDFLSHLS